MADGEERKKQSTLVWVLGGCGGVLVLGVCLTCLGPSVVGLVMTGFDLGSLGATPAAPAYPVATYDAAGLTGGPVLPDPAGPIRPPIAAIDPAQDLTPRRVRFTISTAEGSATFSTGTDCMAIIERRTLGGADYHCHAEVTCGARPLYGGEAQGFFPCQLLMNERRDITGNDDETTQADGDPAFSVDTTVNLISISDDRASPGAADYRITGTVIAIE